MPTTSKLTASFSGQTIRIAVIGGGPAGLYSAYLLQEQLYVPHQITIFEASDRVGGKILYEQFKTVNVRVNQGLKEIYGNPEGLEASDDLRKLIISLGLELEPMHGEGVVMDGRMIPTTEDLAKIYGQKTRDEVEKYIELARSKITPEGYCDQLAVDNTPLDDQKRFTGADMLNGIKDEAARKYVQVATHADCAEEAHRMSAKYFLENWLTNEKDYMRIWTIKGGIERLPEELAKRITAATCEVRYDMTVTKVENGATSADPLTITSTNHGKESADSFDFVLVCLPNNYLNTIEWLPSEFGTKVLEHHQRYDYPAHYVVVSILFEKQFWLYASFGVSGQSDQKLSDPEVAFFDSEFTWNGLKRSEFLKAATRKEDVARFDELARAEAKTERNPSPAQIKAGNYAKGKFTWNGMRIAIENPNGSTRRGISKKGTPWEVTLPVAYGYILGSTSKGDGEHLDVFVGPNLGSNKVFVVTQTDGEGQFDERKAMICFDDEQASIDAYLLSFSDGWGAKIFGSIEEMSVDEFKDKVGAAEFANNVEDESRNDKGEWTKSAVVVGAAERAKADEVEKSISSSLGFNHESDYKFFDSYSKDGKHFVEIKSALKGAKQRINAHDDALLRKVEGMQANPNATFHTIFQDERNTYEGGSHSEHYSGHKLYYRRGNGPYAISSMHPVSSTAELKRLIKMSDDELPEKAKGSLPSGKSVEALRERAAKADVSRKARDARRRAKAKAEGRSVYDCKTCPSPEVS